MTAVLRIGFTDFWPGFDPFDNYFTRLLSASYHLEIVDDPDYLFYSCFGRRHLDHQGVRVFYTGEDVAPDLAVCDYAFTFRLDESDREFRLPLYALYFTPDELVRTPRRPPDAAGKPFCSFLVSNSRAQERIRFFQLLSRYKNVDSGGRVLNNVGPVDDKKAFLARYKFTIAFENRSTPGYTTEKLPEALIAGTLPIYWGNPLVHLDFNPKSFINAHDYGSMEELIEAVIEIDNDDELYRSYLDDPWLPGNKPNRYIDLDAVRSHFDDIIGKGIRRPRTLKHRARERVLVFNEGYTARRALGMKLGRRERGHPGAPR